MEKILSKSLEENIVLFQEIFANDALFKTRRFQNRYLAPVKCCIIYFDGMITVELLNENIIEPILSQDLTGCIDTNNLFEELTYKVILANNVKASTDVAELVKTVNYGDTIFLVDGYANALIIESKGWATRAVSEPDSAKVVRGPKEGFTESIIINLSLIRRKIQHPDLKYKFKEIGTRTYTKICICYIEGLAMEGVLEELEQRLDRIRIDGVLDSGYIQELIKDAPYSPFETVGYSERPDVIASKLLEGRVALVVDGSPFVLTVPYVLAESAQANEDYYNNYLYSSFNRFLRTTGTLISISIPSLFLAVVTYHQEMLPTPLLLSMSAARKGVPFPTALSLVVMLLIFDILREAGTRMPTPVGQAVNIVGALVLGQAAVEAKLVSAPVIIITALSGIATLMSITLIGSTIILRFLLLLATSILGIYGFILGMIILILHLMNLRSFGVPYMLSITTFQNHSGQDTWLRFPWWSMNLRPKIIGAKDLVRVSIRRRRYSRRK